MLPAAMGDGPDDPSSKLDPELFMLPITNSKCKQRQLLIDNHNDAEAGWQKEAEQHLLEFMHYFATFALC